jgi:uncharacterized protein (TIGR02594 family)
MQTKELQTMLLALGYDLGKAGADGVFGRLTTAAIKAFQADHGVSVQWPGTVGPKTEAALAAAYQIKVGATSTFPAALSSAPLLPWYSEAARLQGVTEVAGSKSNSTILGWAKAIGGWVASYFDDDDIPWCGLFMAHCIGATLPEEPLPSNPLGALNWSTFGIACEPQPGAILTFSRDGGGHVGFYVSEDDTYFHVLGGNQSNKVNVTKVAKSRHKATRWPKTAPAPAGKKVVAAFSGTVSTNEA